MAKRSTSTIPDARQLDIFAFEEQAESLLQLSLPDQPERWIAIS